MSESKNKRTKKKQMGQFMTPLELSKDLIKNRKYKRTDKILEPSFGEGSFLIAIIDKLLDVYPEELTIQQKVDLILKNNLFGVEMDVELYKKTFINIQKRYECIINDHNLINDDFFKVEFDTKFDYCEGNPPFGGTFETNFGEKLDKLYGKRDEEKIKKETYSFFTVRCIELLNENGYLGFVCSDTFLSINTMKGLRKYVSKHTIKIQRISFFSDETNYGMVYFDVKINNIPKLKIDGKEINISEVSQTPNYSFLINSLYSKYFTGDTLKKYITCSSGMTIGKNELFLKELINGNIIENYEYEIIRESKTVEKEIKRNKFNKITDSKRKDIDDGVLEDILKINYLDQPKIIQIPNSDYKPYNKSSSEEIYEDPKTYIYWKDEGKAVITFKKTGPWYLHGVGGEKFFNKEGLTWGLISDRIKVRYLPSGYILDSGSPVGVLNEGIEKDELFFIIGWLLSPLSSDILKKVINHTKNIQSKDIERLPYPFWVGEDSKKQIIDFVKKIVSNKIQKKEVDKDYKEKLNLLFKFSNKKN